MSRSIRSHPALRALRVPVSPATLLAAANAFVGLDLRTSGYVDDMVYIPRSVVDVFEAGVGHREVHFPWMPRPRRSTSWDAAFVHHVGHWSHYQPAIAHSSWPVPARATAHALYETGRKWGRLATAPLPGDLFLLWNPETQRCVRTGIVSTVLARRAPLGDAEFDLCEVIEGDTDPERNIRGGWVLRHERRFGKDDRFYRWSGPLRVRPEGYQEEAA